METEREVLLQLVARARRLSMALKSASDSGLGPTEKARLDAALCRLPHEIVSQADLADKADRMTSSVPEYVSS